MTSDAVRCDELACIGAHRACTTAVRRDPCRHVIGCASEPAVRCGMVAPSAPDSVLGRADSRSRWAQQLVEQHHYCWRKKVPARERRHIWTGAARPRIGAHRSGMRMVARTSPDSMFGTASRSCRTRAQRQSRAPLSSALDPSRMQAAPADRTRTMEAGWLRRGRERLERPCKERRSGSGRSESVQSATTPSCE